MIFHLFDGKEPSRFRTCKPVLEILEDRQLLSASWPEFALNPQHTALSTVASQPLQAIRWQTPVDLQPQYTFSQLLIHYGSPLITASNTVIVPLKTQASGGFELEAINPATGSLSWTQSTDYVLPPLSPSEWIPSYSPVLTPQNRLYFPGPGGTTYYIDNPDTPGSHVATQIAFYGIANYNHAGFDGSVFIDTPITSDSAGNIFFGFVVSGVNPLNLVSGMARIDANGVGTWISASTATGDPNTQKVGYNCAPALSNDSQTLYVGMNGGSVAYLVALNSTTLATMSKVGLLDPFGNNAVLSDNGTASPMVGSDGDVYFGITDHNFGNNARGWMLHFSGDLSQTKIPGAFGWDDTASVVPASMVPSYQGTSSYLIMTKYNNYVGFGTGNGMNKVAVLDPNATEIDPISGATVMNEVLTVLGPTPSSDGQGVDEWCINTAVVDPFTKSILVNSEDGKLYRWDMTTNTLSEAIRLTLGVGEAYTPTLIGPDGVIYAINNAKLFAVGNPKPSAITGRAQQSGQIWTGVSTGSSFTTSMWSAWSTGTTWIDVLTGDFTGDGRTDIAARDANTGKWWVGISNGSAFSMSVWTTWSTGVTWADVQVGDFNGDGKADITGRYKEGGTWWVALSTGSSFTDSLWETWSTSATWVDVKVGDFNGDGMVDITGRYLQGGTWWTGISTGGGFDTRKWATWSTSVNWVDVQVGDFNGDGQADITGRAFQTGDWWTSLSRGSTYTGTFTTSKWATWSTSVNWVDVKVGDFNGDGISDIVGRALQTGDWWAGISNGSAFTTSKWDIWSTGVTWVDVQVGDFNGDGKADITGRALQTGDWWTGLSNGSAFTTTRWATWSTGVNWTAVRTGDFA